MLLQTIIVPKDALILNNQFLPNGRFLHDQKSHWKWQMEVELYYWNSKDTQKTSSFIGWKVPYAYCAEYKIIIQYIRIHYRYDIKAIQEWNVLFCKQEMVPIFFCLWLIRISVCQFICIIIYVLELAIDVVPSFECSS